MRLLLLLSALAAVSSARYLGGEPHFCRNYTCPPFETVERYHGFEVRCYQEATYVVTKADKIDEKDFEPMFVRLFAYFNGDNVAKKTFDLTVPVLVGLYYNITTHQTQSGMALYFPYDSPPAPNNETLSIYKAKSFCAYVRPFHGNVSGPNEKYYTELYHLSRAILKHGKDYLKGLSMFAGYTDLREEKHYNEVWRVPAHKKRTEAYIPDFIPTSTWEISDWFESKMSTKDEIDENPQADLEE